MAKKDEPTGLERKMFGRTLAEWAKMTPDERLADDKIGAKRIGPLNDAIAAALGTASTIDAAPPAAAADTEPETPAAAPAGPAADGTQDPDKLKLLADLVASQAPADASTEPAGDTTADQPAEALSDADTIDDVAGEPTIGEVCAALATAPEPTGYCTRSPTPTLSPEQARLQSQLYAILTARGVVLRSQGQVYAWLLDRVAASVAS